MKKMPKSICKHIRKEKARIRREVFGLKKQEEKIEELRQRFFLIKSSHENRYFSSGKRDQNEPDLSIGKN